MNHSESDTLRGDKFWRWIAQHSACTVQWPSGYLLPFLGTYFLSTGGEKRRSIP